MKSHEKWRRYSVVGVWASIIVLWSCYPRLTAVKDNFFRYRPRSWAHGDSSDPVSAVLWRREGLDRYKELSDLQQDALQRYFIENSGGSARPSGPPLKRLRLIVRFKCGESDLLKLHIYDEAVKIFSVEFEDDFVDWYDRPKELLEILR